MASSSSPPNPSRRWSLSRYAEDFELHHIATKEEEAAILASRGAAKGKAKVQAKGTASPSSEADVEFHKPQRKPAKPKQRTSDVSNTSNTSRRTTRSASAMLAPVHNKSLTKDASSKSTPAKDPRSQEEETAIQTVENTNVGSGCKRTFKQRLQQTLEDPGSPKTPQWSPLTDHGYE